MVSFIIDGETGMYIVMVSSIQAECVFACIDRRRGGAAEEAEGEEDGRWRVGMLVSCDGQARSPPVVKLWRRSPPVVKVVAAFTTGDQHLQTATEWAAGRREKPLLPPED